MGWLILVYIIPLLSLIVAYLISKKVYYKKNDGNIWILRLQVFATFTITFVAVASFLVMLLFFIADKMRTNLFPR